jgi:hypothetical protein
MSYTYSGAKLFAAADLTLMRSYSKAKMRRMMVQRWTLTTAQVGQFGLKLLYKRAPKGCQGKITIKAGLSIGRFVWPGRIAIRA